MIFRPFFDHSFLHSAKSFFDHLALAAPVAAIRIITIDEHTTHLPHIWFILGAVLNLFWNQNLSKNGYRKGHRPGNRHRRPRHPGGVLGGPGGVLDDPWGHLGLTLASPGLPSPPSGDARGALWTVLGVPFG